MYIALFIIGVLWTVLGILMQTQNLMSAVVFKAMPFITGGFICYVAALNLSWI